MKQAIGILKKLSIERSLIDSQCLLIILLIILLPHKDFIINLCLAHYRECLALYHECR